MLLVLLVSFIARSTCHAAEFLLNSLAAFIVCGKTHIFFLKSTLFLLLTFCQ